MARLTSTEDLVALREKVRASRDPDALRIIVCGGTACRSAGSLELADALSAEMARRGLEGRTALKLSGCHGFCQQGPVVVVEPHGIFYSQVGRKTLEQDVRDIVETTLIGGSPVERLLYTDPATGEPVTKYDDIPFYSGQTRIVLRNNGRIDPNDIEDYIAADGYAALAKAFAADPEEVISWITRSGLRGRGGGGFPTGKKWQFCRQAADRSMRYIICNADEGDPGAFMDRSIVEGDPHAVVEGMIVGAYAISRGVSPAEGHVYIRAEYPLAITTLRNALVQAEEAGVLGDDILGSGFGLHIKLKEGAGAFVCGEETALIASIEGRRGMPRVRPPFPASSGLFGKPTNINNVETWASVPRIITGGPDWYAGIGTEGSRGTKVFSLVGKVNNSGLIEVPMGTKLKDIVFGMGGGIPRGKRFKAVQTGGPSGGCLPGSCLELPVDYETLAEAGSIMGSGGMVVMDEDTCIPDIARYFVSFTKEESCGKCSPCRLGTWQMNALLEDICAGRATNADVALLEEMAGSVKAASLCGLGQTAPNPVLTTLRYFRDEYESHVRWKKCPAAVCEELVRAPCTHTCPAGVDVPRYVRLVAAGRLDDALEVIRERIPFPSVCGRVCFEPCAAKCRRGPLDGAISVRALKRFASEHGRVELPERAPPTGKKVAVVGAGPAGLTAAYYLALAGHAVTVFEQSPGLGGMLRDGIPAYRLPRDVLDAEIGLVLEAGVEVRRGERVSSSASLLEKGFDAVFLAPGAGRGLPLRAPGEGEEGVLQAVDFLREANRGEKVELGERVAVIGGGNTAIDAARTAVRLGAKEVTILYRRSRDQMPAGAEEVAAAEEEGVRLELLAAPVKIERSGGRLAVHLVRTELGPFDDSGRPRPVPVEGSEFALEFDNIIAAVGQEVDPGSCEGLDLDRRGRVVAEPETLAASCEGVFAGGDAVLGPASAIEAIAQGRRAAGAVDRYLGGSGEIDRPTKIADPELPPLEEGEIPPVLPRLRPAEGRAASFEEVELCYSPEEARREALRCLRCDLERSAEETDQ